LIKKQIERTFLHSKNFKIAFFSFNFFIFIKLAFSTIPTNPSEFCNDKALNSANLKVIQTTC